MARSERTVTTTTETVPGYTVTRYVGVVTAHVVAGTGLFSDIAASWSDLFGGRSRSYQKQFAAIDQEVIQQLRERAERLGGNAVIGLRVDHDEVSGGGKQMFMVTASGTAVVVEHERGEPAGPLSGGTFDSEEIRRRQTRRYLVTQAEAGKLSLNDENWTFLTRHAVSEVAPVIAQHVRSQFDAHPHEEPPDAQRASDYFRVLPHPDAADALYALSVHGEPRVRKFARTILLELEMLDLDRIAALLGEEDLDTKKRALWLIHLDKPAYALSDIPSLERLASLVPDRFPDRWSERQKPTLMGKEKTVADCPCGSTHDAEVAHCPKCGQDRRGFFGDEKKPEAYTAAIRARVQAIREAAQGGDTTARC